MNTPVSFLLAKLAIQKGFDKECKEYWNLIEYSSEWIVENRINLDSVDFMNAPTISDVVMWLYEKHIIWIQVKPGGRLETWDFIVQKKDNHFAVPFFEIKQHKPYFNSPTEAYEAAIEYTLNNLI